MLDKLKQDIIAAMKNKDKVTLDTLRGVKGALQLEVINNKKEESDELLLEVINKQIKMRNDSIEEFKKANRDDLIESYTNEVNILKEYMPEQLSQEELEKILKDAIEKTGASCVKDLGSVMKEINFVIKNRCNMKEVTEKLKSLLS